MAASITVPNIFANQSGPIPLAQLDTDLSTVYTAVNSLLSFSNYYVDSSGTPNSLIVTVASPQVVAYTAGLVLFVKAANTTTGASTITVNALGTKSIVTNTGGVIPAGAIVVGSIVKLVYDGTNFQLLSFAGAGVAGGSTTQVQFNDGGILNGATGLTYAKATGLLTVAAPTAGSHALVGVAGLTSFTGLTGLGLQVRGATSTNDYSGIDFSDSTANPKARIAAIFTGSGSKIVIGTSNAYGSGITNSAVTINEVGATTIATASGIQLTLTGPAATSNRSLDIGGTTTAFNYARFSNTGGELWLGIESSGGSGVIGGTTAYTSFIGSAAATPFALASNGTARVIIGSVGNVTINAPSSGTALAISGLTSTGLLTLTSTGASALMGFGWNAGITSNAWNIYSSSTDPLAIGTAAAASFTINTNSLPRIVTTAAGNVTINAPSSGGALTVSGLTATNTLTLNSTGAASGVGLGWNTGVGGTSWSFYTSSTDPLWTGTTGAASYTIATNNLNRLVVSSAGAVSIAAPTAANAGLTVSGSAATPPVAIAFSAAAGAIDATRANVYTTTLTGNVTSAYTISNAQDGQTINWFLTQDATGSRTMTWPASFKWPGGVAGVLSTAINSVDLLVATFRSSTGFWYANLMNGFA